MSPFLWLLIGLALWLSPTAIFLWLMRSEPADDIADRAELVMPPAIPDTAAGLIAAWTLTDPIPDPYGITEDKEH